MILLSEVGDLCAQDQSSFYTPANYDYMVQRSWSNDAANSGRDPCQPALPGTVYFAAVPELTDDVTFTYYGQSAPTKGVQIAVGQSKTIPVHLFSEAARGNWTVAAFALSANGPSGKASFTWDHTSGNNGDTLNLTIKLNSNDSNFGGVPFAVMASSGSEQHMYLGFIGQ
jgi:hypothetical protein